MRSGLRLNRRQLGVKPLTTCPPFFVSSDSGFFSMKPGLIPDGITVNEAEQSVCVWVRANNNGVEATW